MSETPIYVVEAVQAFKENRREPLLNLFHNGIPLQSYPESRELIEKLFRGERIRGRGEKIVDPHKESRDISIQMSVAQLVGAIEADGLKLPFIRNADEREMPSICLVVGKWHGLSANQVKNIYKKAEGSQRVSFYKQFGGEHAESILEGLRMTGEI